MTQTPRAGTDVGDVVAIAGLALALAQSQQASIIQASDNYDTKAVGVAAFDATLFAALIAVQDKFAHWWVPGIPILISGGFCAWCLIGRTYDLGVHPDLFYQMYGGATEAEATVQMLSTMTDTLKNNDGTLAHKGFWFQAAIVLTLTALIVGAITLRT